jgi:putative phosphoesterase
MRIGIVSDIHGNVLALVRALEDMGDVDAIFCAGDAINHYHFSNEIFDIIRERGILTVLGNHERDFLFAEGCKGSSDNITSENIAYLQTLSNTLELNLDGKRIFMTHGSPWEPINEYIFPGNRKLAMLSTIRAHIVILGHTHYPMVVRRGGVLVINPGSCGSPRDLNLRVGSTYALLDTHANEVVIKTLDVPLFL